MPDPSQLSKRERQIMDVIYAHGQATITQVLAEMPDPPMRGALRTLLRIMEAKGPPRSSPGRPRHHLSPHPTSRPGRPIGLGQSA